MGATRAKASSNGRKSKGSQDKKKKAKSSVSLTKEDVLELEASIAKGPEHANKIITLLKAFRLYSRSSASAPTAAAAAAAAPVALACLHSLRRVFSTQIQRGAVAKAMPPPPGATDSAAAAADPEQLFRQWNRKQYLSYIDALVACIVAPAASGASDIQLRLVSLRTIMTFVASEFMVSNAPPGTFGNMTFLKLMRAVIRRGCPKGDVAMEQVLDVLADEYMSSFDDVSLFSLRNLRNIMTNGVDAATRATAIIAAARSGGASDGSRGDAGSSSAEISLEPAQVMACYRLLKVAAVPEDAEELANMPDLLCPLPDTDQEENAADEAQELEDEESSSSSDGDSSDSGGEGAASGAATSSNGRAKKKKTRQKTLRPVLDIKKHRAAFDGAWRAFVNLKGLPKGLVKTVLFSMSDKVLPALEHPLMLADFLTAALDYGGMIGIVAIHAIFLLVNEHGLDYPDFYEKLYTLVTPQVFLMKYRRRFFDLMWLFLRSPNLSAALIASFCKRVSRLALSAPPHGAVFATALVFNLLQRHRACRVLVDDRRRTKESEEVQATGTSSGSGTTSGAAASAEHVLQHGDPYRFDCLDFEKSRALDSSLWELKSLERHYCGTIASLMTAFDHHLDNRKFSLRMEDLAGLDYSQLISNNIDKIRKNKARKSAGGPAKRGRRSRKAAAVEEDEPVVVDDVNDDDNDEGSETPRPGGLSVRVAFAKLF